MRHCAIHHPVSGRDHRDVVCVCPRLVRADEHLIGAGRPQLGPCPDVMDVGIGVVDPIAVDRHVGVNERELADGVNLCRCQDTRVEPEIEVRRVERGNRPSQRVEFVGVTVSAKDDVFLVKVIPHPDSTVAEALSVCPHSAVLQHRRAREHTALRRHSFRVRVPDVLDGMGLEVEDRRVEILELVWAGGHPAGFSADGCKA